jgi:hypothetical protein
MIAITTSNSMRVKPRRFREVQQSIFIKVSSCVPRRGSDSIGPSRVLVIPVPRSSEAPAGRATADGNTTAHGELTFSVADPTQTNNTILIPHYSDPNPDPLILILRGWTPDAGARRSRSGSMSKLKSGKTLTGEARHPRCCNHPRPCCIAGLAPSLGDLRI